jgi:hypothetical protein
MSSSVMARSAVASVRTPGVLVTTIPASRAASMSMLLNPTPKLPMKRVRTSGASSISALSRSATHGRSTSAEARADLRPSSPSGSSGSLRVTWVYVARSFSSTDVGQRRVTTMVGSTGTDMLAPGV